MIIGMLRRLTKSMATIRGVRRIPEYVQHKWSDSDELFTIDDFDGNLKFQSVFSSHIGSHIFWKGFYARNILALLNRLLDHSDMVLFDVGANEGEETVFSAKRIPEGQVFAFEPNPSVRSRLVQNVALNGFHNVSIQSIGLDSQPGTRVLYGPSERSGDGTVNEGQGTIYPREGVDTPLGQITLSTLDMFVAEHNVPRVDLIKIDVEGAELNVLKGGDRVLIEHRPKLIVEVWENADRSMDLLHYIIGKEYAVFNIASDGSTTVASDLKRTTRDVLCVSKRG